MLVGHCLSPVQPARVLHEHSATCRNLVLADRLSSNDCFQITLNELERFALEPLVISTGRKSGAPNGGSEFYARKRLQAGLVPIVVGHGTLPAPSALKPYRWPTCNAPPVQQAQQSQAPRWSKCGP